MTGKRFASITGIKVTGKSSSGDLKWLFGCDCGSQFEANGYYARSGKVTTCPACAAERSRMGSIIHGMTESPEFKIWTGMHTRCYNPNTKAWPYYGGRGICVCKRWLASFENFLADMGPRPSSKHSIDRINNDGNYEPSNCRWATALEQNSNKRTTVRVPSEEGRLIRDLAQQVGISNSAMWLRVKKGKSTDMVRPSKLGGCVTFQGITDTYKGWSARTGIKPSTIAMRIHSCGWPIEQALTQGALL